MPNWEEIRREWETNDISFKDLAEKHNVKNSTIRSRKNREKWQRNNVTQRATKKTGVATEKGKVAPAKKKKATSIRAQKRSGNPNPKNQFTERNRAALKHGMFSRYMPKETLEIMGQVAEADPADILWMQIEIQFAAIIRAQRIMFVQDEFDTTKELKKLRPGEFGDEQEWEIQFAWDKQATFLNAQSRAISELRTSIRQFVDMVHEDDERLLKLDMMQANITKAKAETDKLTKENKQIAPPTITIVDAWGDGDE